MTTQNCKYCGCPVNWDKLINKSYTKKDGKQVNGWWREDLSKEEHTKERCENFQKTNEWRTSTNKETPKPQTENVNWPNELTEYSPDQQNVLLAEQIYCQMAVEATKKLHPNMDPNSSTFGQIVSAKEGHLIQLAKIKAIRELKEK